MSWEDEDFDFDAMVPETLKEKEKAPAPAAAAAPVDTSRAKHQAKARAKALAEIEAKEAEAAARRARMMEESTGDAALDRRRREEMQIRADLEAAEDAFGGVDAIVVEGEEAKEPDVAALLDTVVLNKPAKFEAFAAAVASRVEAQDSKADTMVFLRKLLVESTGPLNSDDLKELSKMLDIERNRKMEAERLARGGKKKGKGKKTKPKTNANKATDNWKTSMGDEYDDFM